MKKLSAALKKYYHIIVFDVFFLIEAYALMAIPLTGDDFYYGSLTRFGFGSFISEISKIYMNSDGHVATGIVSGLFAWLPISVWRIVTLIAVGAIVWLTASAAAGKDKKKFPLALTLSSIGFAMLDLAALRETVYYLTGSVGFVIPLLLVLVFLRVFSDASGDGRGAWYIPFLAFVTSLWSEQAAICVIIILIPTMIGSRIRLLSVRATHVMAFPAAILGLAVILLSPGRISARGAYASFYSMGLFDRIGSNSERFFGLLFGTEGMLFVLVMFFALAGFAAVGRIIKAEKGTSSAKLVIDAMLMIFPFMTAIVLVISSPLVPVLYVRTGIVAGLVTVSFVLVIADSVMSFISDEDPTPFVSVLGAVSVLVWTLLQPDFGSRMLLLPAVLLFIPAIRYAFAAFEIKVSLFVLPAAFSLYAAWIVSPHHRLGLFVLVYAAFLISLMTPAKKLNSVVAVFASLAVLFAVAYGYNLNRGVNYRNEKAAEAVASGEDTDGVLTLSMPVKTMYEYRPLRYSTYHQAFFRRYYGIPENVEIEFVPYTEITDWQ